MRTRLVLIASLIALALPARAGLVPGGKFSRAAPGRRDFDVGCYLGFYGGRRASGSAFLLDSWVPLHLLLRNNTRRAFEGELVCRVRDRRSQNTYEVTYRTRVLLAGRGSRKHIELEIYVPPAGFSSDRGLFDFVLESKTHCAMRLAPANLGGGSARAQDMGNEVLQRELLLVLGRRGLALPSALRHGGRNYQFLCVQGEVASLPRHWTGYSGVSGVVWDGSDISRLDEFVRRALAEYVEAGGHLVICAGNNRSLLTRDGFLMELLPCGLGANTRLDLGRTLLGGGGLPPATVTRLRPRAGAVVLARGAEGMPLVVRRDLGAGAITVIAFSPGEEFCRRRLARRQGRLVVDPAWSKWGEWIAPVLVRRADFLQARARQDIRRCAYRYLAGSATKRIPKRRHVFAFLAVYTLVLVPLTYALFRGRRRPELAWVATPLISLAFFAGGYWVAFRDLAKSIAITDVCVVRAAPDGRGGNLTMSLVYNPSYELVDLGFVDPRQMPIYLRTDSVPGSEEDLRYAHRLEEQPTGGVVLRGQQIDFDSSRAFESSGITRLGDGLRARLRVPPAGWAGERVLGRADNRTGIYLTDLALVAGDRGVLLAPLPAADGRELRVAAGMGPEPVAGVCALLGRGRDDSRLRDLLLLALDQAARGERRAFILGLLRRSTTPWLVNGKPSRGKGLTILVVPVDSAPVPPLEFEVPSYPVDEDLPGNSW